jgi:hypothetical protein
MDKMEEPGGERQQRSRLPLLRPNVLRITCGYRACARTNLVHSSRTLPEQAELRYLFGPRS